MLVMLQPPTVDVLGTTAVTCNAWRDEEVQRTLRMLELTGNSRIPVVPGAVFPLVRTQEETNVTMKLTGKPTWLGAWGSTAGDIPLPAGTALDPAKPARSLGNSCPSRRHPQNQAAR